MKEGKCNGERNKFNGKIKRCIYKNIVQKKNERKKEM